MAPAIKPKPRTRLDPELRQTQILDQAARLIADDGLTALSMERIAQTAGVSKALVYAYFSNQTALLQTLLVRDMKRIQREQAQAVQEARDFPDMVRRTTHIALVEVEKRGAFVQRLLAEPSVAAVMGPIRAHEHSANVRYLARRIVENFDVPMDQALRIVEIGLGLTVAAANYLQRTQGQREEIEELTTAMILGAVGGAAKLRKKSRKAATKRRAQG